MGAKSAEMLRYIPEIKLDVVERCSGHGGTFGVMKDTFDAAMSKVGKTAARNVAKTGNKYVTSDCPLAAKHLTHEDRDDGRAAASGAAAPGRDHGARLGACLKTCDEEGVSLFERH